MYNAKDILPVIVIITIYFTACSNNKPDVKFSKDRMPTTKPAQVYGYYSSGCVDGAVALPETGNGYSVIRPSKKRFFGHPALIKYIKALAGIVHQGGLGNILVSDMSMPRGGPIHDYHISHQNGLDVDILYNVISDKEKNNMTHSDYENMEVPSVVNENFLSLNRSVWNSSHVKLIQLAAGFEQVERIYVDPLIKKELCKKFYNEKWITKIRPWWHHHDHFHVRIKCPAGSTHCVPQKNSHLGADCTSLSWWFSGRAKKERIQYNIKSMRKKLNIPELPERCKDILLLRKI